MDEIRQRRLIDLVVETVGECTGASNNHLVVTTGDDDEARRGIAQAVEDRIDDDPKLRKQFMAIRIGEPRPREPARLATLWARAIDGTARKMDDTQRASGPFAKLNEWTAGGRRPEDALMCRPSCSAWRRQAAGGSC